MSWELCQTIKNIGMMIYRVSKTSRECCICTGCPGKLQKGNNFHHFRVQKAVHIQGMSRDGLLLSVWDRAFCWCLSVALISGSGFQNVTHSAISCPLHRVLLLLQLQWQGCQHSLDVTPALDLF